ncbi:MAG: hypothetical protein KA735_10245 [Burkholderiaceae bacterium]|nr:hypothetical protein [Burkholderiaceae bacterium]
MGLFNKLPGYVPAQAGLERVILRGIPFSLVAGVGIIWLPSLLIRLWNWSLDTIQLQAVIGKTDIYAFGVMWCYCNLMVALGIWAFIIMLMKGPAYVADAYPLPDADKPADPLK